MKPIVTLTLNPSIDGSSRADTVQPVRKIRTSNERFDPGGGGINVARVVRELGGEAFAVYLAGGTTGNVLDELMRAHHVPFHRVPIDANTRIAHVVYERASGKEFRFTPEGPEVSRRALEEALNFLTLLDLDIVVASGSLPAGLPQDSYLRVAELVKAKGGRLFVDTSGGALRRVADTGCYFLKPSLGELESLVGHKLDGRAAQEDAARQLVERGVVEVLAVTMGGDGAMLATREEITWMRAPDVAVQSAVGAGDSFVGAMAYAIGDGRPITDAFALGVAAGTATVLTSGTELCRRADVDHLYDQIIRSRAQA